MSKSLNDSNLLTLLAMKLFKKFSILVLILSYTSIQAQNLQQQKKYFPKSIKKMNVFLGSTEQELLNKCDNCVDQKTEESFRRVYLSNLDDKEFQSAIFYVSTSKSEIYEVILTAKEGIDVNKIANKLFGSPNAENNEWRYFSDKTKQKFTMAMWVFKNKLVIAGDIQGSEWEKGFE